MPYKTCYECGEVGHVKSNCPNIKCHRCHQKGHFARDCSYSKGKQQRFQQTGKRVTSSLPPPSSNAHKLPDHWKISSEYTSLANAVTGLWKENKKYEMFEADPVERLEIERLVNRTWREEVVGYGADARNLSHTNMQVVKVERVENPEMYERYSERKQKLLRRLRDPDLGDTAFTPVDKLPGSTGPVLTTRKMEYNSFLRRNIYPKINEHYLFHGTKDEYVKIIARDGMDNRFGSQHSLLGPGLYTAESCTKADQYTDNKASRSSGLHKMFLVRVLVGEPYINTSKKPPKFQRPPCRSCQQILCNCAHTQHYDSVLDDCGRLFREFVVYEQCQCYPEYLVTYSRVDKNSPQRAITSSARGATTRSAAAHTPASAKTQFASAKPTTPSVVPTASTRPTNARSTASQAGPLGVSVKTRKSTTTASVAEVIASGAHSKVCKPLPPSQPPSGQSSVRPEPSEYWIRRLRMGDLEGCAIGKHNLGKAFDQMKLEESLAYAQDTGNDEAPIAKSPSAKYAIMDLGTLHPRSTTQNTHLRSSLRSGSANTQEAMKPAPLTNQSEGMDMARTTAESSSVSAIPVSRPSDRKARKKKRKCVIQ